MKSIGRSVRKSGNDIQAELHPSFRGKYSNTDIPDGMIQHKRGDAIWRAAVEVKVKSSDLDLPQLERYLKQASEHGFNALVTISNEMCISPDRPPLRLKTSDRKLKDIEHFHWSWSAIRHQAMNLLEDDNFDDEGQRYILSEFVRFLQDSATGVEGFKQMGKHWKELVEDLRTRAAGTPQEFFEQAVSDWHQECADLSFQLSSCLGQRVTQVLSKTTKTREARLDKDVEHLMKTGDLKAEFDVGDGNNYLSICLEIDQRTLRISKRCELPKNVKTPHKRIEHFIRKIAGKDEEAEDGQHEGMRISVKWPYVSNMTSTTLFDAMQDVSNGELSKNRLINNDKDTVQYVELQYCPIGVASKVSSRKSVIDLVEQSLSHFCDHYLEI
ncbi:hypothetical protein [uncultured Algimonas sp.]|uniref:hypothetical protein n=1 Tax=uncultured Algimonas sp. TaxID=1547920 RepID=UPI002619365E|nr:hypothetical protein [uncultured Algimonas sp.]